MVEYTIIDCPDCKGGGKVIETWVSHSLFSYNEFEKRTNIDCSRCCGLGKLKTRLSDIKESNERITQRCTGQKP